MAPPRRSVRLARELAEDPALRLDERYESPHILRHLCALADDKTNCGDRDGLRVAGLCCRLAGRLGSAEARASSFARLATALRLANRFEHAERALEIGLAAAPPGFEGDLIRRRAWLRIYQGRLSEGLRDAQAALALARNEARAKALEVVGVSLSYNGRYRAAIRHLASCLAETDPNDDVRYCNAIHNYATSLARGSDDEAAEAVELCAEARRRLKPRHKMQRAKLWWTQGLLQQRLGDPRSAWWSLDTARRSLVALQAAPEVAAIVADMARVSPEPPAIRHLCDEAAGIVAAHRTLTRPLRSLASAARERIPEAAAALWRAATVLAPCPAV